VFSRHPSRPVFKRLFNQPLIEPRADIAWEAGGTMSPAVVKTADGYRMLYRAFGSDRISRLGLAISKDGIEWRRYADPVITPQGSAEKWGIEDPRLVELEGQLVVSYTAASGRDEPDGWHWTTRIRLAESSLKDSFKTDCKRIVPELPDLDNKDAALFPERIDGSYWMLHRLMPDIWISRSQDLVTWTDHERIVEPLPETWESLRIGAGAPPIKTKLGWLVFHHGVSVDLTYSMSALMLDLHDPTKVLYRLPYPLLVPTEAYELRGVVSKVVFGTSVTDEGKTWRLYYGAADEDVAAAEINKRSLLDALQAYPAESAPPSKLI
jgi:predicted GH43/DUF377 family glycosyl hydrolase